MPSPPKRPPSTLDAPPGEEGWPPLALTLSIAGLVAVVVLLPFLGVTDTLAEFILAYVLVLPAGALLYGLLAFAADLIVSKPLFLGSPPGLWTWWPLLIAAACSSPAI